ncbi:(deoxy)nucleoside triphosphate pyrophosphohydrolase [uncultured Dubosiella sp.]|uniref:(deoxy)nucleoside triphosphate pyrophosphohydrolase n=1 Tax=uncultured Dubosiella sp. TaxID=1937011 RepID=UPI0020875EB3|nr:(deoxy)nucleoside triphosphate pyrophosphohydrolase [uncultured Dubosiella sp.]GJM57248.1 DNA mismatch repair protein MutT [Erysipelotrichaceae bacterium OPF54]
MKKEIDVVAAIIVKDQYILATQRGYGDFKGGWEFPGGKVEVNESKEHALEREIAEELKVKIRIDSFFMHVDHEYPDFILHMDCFLCSIEEGKIVLVEHENAKWLSIDQLDTVDWLPADVAVAKKLKQQL